MSQRPMGENNNNNLVYNNNLDDMQAGYPIKSSLSFWRIGYGSSGLVYHVSLLWEIEP
jgi:hypothetical protein